MGRDVELTSATWSFRTDYQTVACNGKYVILFLKKIFFIRKIISKCFSQFLFMKYLEEIKFCLKGNIYFYKNIYFYYKLYIINNEHII